MPLRDHFRPPVDDFTSWDTLHGGWPMVIVQKLGPLLPRRFVAAPLVHMAGSVEIDVGTFHEDEPISSASYDGANGEGGGVATAIWAPPKPTVVLQTNLPAPGEYEVRIYDRKRGRRLVAAIEIVSPSNKDRPETRRAFVAKCAALLQERVSVVIVDLVTTREFNLYADLLELIGQKDPSLGDDPPPIYTTACRGTREGKLWFLEGWFQPLQLGQALPTMPLWLADDLAIPLELEGSYEEACRALRIP